MAKRVRQSRSGEGANASTRQTKMDREHPGRGAGDTAGNRGATGSRLKSMREYLDEDLGDVDGKTPDEMYEELKDSARKIFGPSWGHDEKADDPRSARGRYSNARGKQNDYRGRNDSDDDKLYNDEPYMPSSDNGSDVIEQFQIARENYIQAREAYQNFLNTEEI